MKAKRLLWLLSLFLVLAGCGQTSTSSDQTDTSSSSAISSASQTDSTSATSSISTSSSSARTTTTSQEKVGTNEAATETYRRLSQMTFQSGDNIILQVNDNKSTLQPSDWQQEQIDYGDLDQLNRTTTDTAYLSRRNLGRSANREAQRFRPTGWHNQPKYVDGKRLFPQNRGHLIAYTMTFNLDLDGHYVQGEDGSLDNPKNLATQSDFSNKNPMQDYETQVRTGLQRGKKVIYQVTTVFREDELMARGYWVQAISTDGTINFNAYIFNVEPKVVFDYSTGQSKVDQTFKVTYHGRLRN